MNYSEALLLGLPIITSPYLTETKVRARTWRERLLSTDLPDVHGRANGPWLQRPWEPFRTHETTIVPSSQVLLIGNRQLIAHPETAALMGRLLPKEAR